VEKQIFSVGESYNFKCKCSLGNTRNETYAANILSTWEQIFGYWFEEGQIKNRNIFKTIFFVWCKDGKKGKTCVSQDTEERHLIFFYMRHACLCNRPQGYSSSVSVTKTTLKLSVLQATSFGSGIKPSSGLNQEQRYRKTLKLQLMWHLSDTRSLYVLDRQPTS
jgi:hypothetical protein